MKLKYIHCPVCGSSNYKDKLDFKDNKIDFLISLNDNLKKYNIIYKVVMCKNCGLYYQNPRLDDSDLSELYKEEYKTNNYINHLNEHQRSLRDDGYINIINKYLKLSNDNFTILDVGTSDCAFLKRLKNKKHLINSKIIGIDKYSVYESTDNIDFYNDDFIKYEFKNEFDLITFFDVIEHLNNINDALNKTHFLLKNNGLLIFVVPNYNSISRIFKRNKWGMLIAEHLTFYTKESIKLMLKQNNFKLVKMHFINNYLFTNVFFNKVSNYIIKKQKYNKNDFKKGNKKNVFRKLLIIMDYMLHDLFGIFLNMGDNIMIIAKKGENNE